MKVLGPLHYRGVLHQTMGCGVNSQPMTEKRVVENKGETCVKTRLVEGILRGRPHVALSVDGVCDKQAAVNCVTSGVIKPWLNKEEEKKKLGSEWQNIP